MSLMKKIISFALIIIMIYTLSLTINAYEWQNLSTKNITEYSVNDGLTNNIGNALAETDDGYIWIGQYAGLTKYNGKKFITISYSDGVELDGILTMIAVKNTLYIGSQKHFIKYENGKFQIIELLENENITVTGLSEYNNIVYVSSNKGLFKYSNNEITKLNNLNLIDVAAGANGIYFITTDNELYSFNTGEKYKSELSFKSVEIINNRLYIGSTSGQMIMQYENTSTIVDVSSKSINTFVYGKETLYIGCDDGVFTYTGGVVYKFKDFPITNSVESILIDFQENVWVVSSSNGLIKISDNAFDDMFIAYNVKEYLDKLPVPLKTTCVNAVANYKGLLYVATDDCLLIFDESKKAIVDNELTKLLYNVRVRDLKEFDGKLYIGTYSSNLCLLVYDGTNISYITSDKLNLEGVESNPSGSIRCLVSTGDSLFVGTNYGISKITKDKIVNIKPPYRPLYLYFDNETLYACIENQGIYMYNSNLEFQGIIPNTESKTCLKCLINDDKLIYCINGSLFSYQNGETQKIGINIIGSIVELLFINNKYYIGTDSDIYVIEKNDLFKKNPSYRTLGRSEGLKSGLNSNASGLYGSNGIYYFAGRDSLYAYNMNYNSKIEIQSKLAISKVEVDGITLTNPSEIDLVPSANRLQVYFDILSFIDYNTFKVYYKLEGVDDSFTEMDYDMSSSITYTNLKGGDYNLIIYAINSNGIESQNILSLRINKQRGIFEYPLFIAALIVLGIALLVFIVLTIAKMRIREAKKRQEEYKKITLESIEAIARTIDAKDKYTNGHSTRVGKYSKLIAESLGMDEDECRNIYYIGLLHDIGKISVPRDILNKPSRLTDEEFEIIKKHTTEGGKILSSISTIPYITEGAIHHHEKYNGSGYPDGIDGKNIPFVARIICCADCYDAMATKRSYKEEYSKEKIISEFERCSGSQFDPEIAKKVVELIKKDIIKPE